MLENEMCYKKGRVSTRDFTVFKIAMSLSPNENSENFRNFCWVIRTQPSSLLKVFLLYDNRDPNISWLDPYNSFWLKLATFGVYFVELISSVTLIAFVVYETNGYAGHYRTLINQLLSFLYAAVSLHFKNPNCCA